jgi:hypothetical protein
LALLWYTLYLLPSWLFILVLCCNVSFRDGQTRTIYREHWRPIHAHFTRYLQLLALLDIPEHAQKLYKDGLDACDRQAFLTLAAFREGWEVAQQMVTPDYYVCSEAEVQELEAAKRQAKAMGQQSRNIKTPKHTAGGSPGQQLSFTSSPVFNPWGLQMLPGFGQSPFPGTASLGQKTPGTGNCFRCGLPGHWSRDCPSSQR